ncbi:hypothetical protein ACVWYF_000367 [Hymenobacter sp. UYAg731]
MNKTVKKPTILLPDEGSLKPLAVKAPRQAEYVDPYLYEVGFFESPDERARLVATTPIKPCQ